MLQDKDIIVRYYNDNNETGLTGLWIHVGFHELLKAKELKKEILDALEFKKTWVNTEHTLTTTKHYNDLKEKADKHDIICKFKKKEEQKNKQLESQMAQLKEILGNTLADLHISNERLTTIELENQKNKE